MLVVGDLLQTSIERVTVATCPSRESCGLGPSVGRVWVWVWVGGGLGVGFPIPTTRR